MHRLMVLLALALALSSSALATASGSSPRSSSSPTAWRVAAKAKPAKPAKAKAKPEPPPPACPEPPPPPPPPPRPSTVRVMLPDLTVAPRFTGAREALGQIVAEEAARVKGYELLSAADVRAVIDQEAAKQLVGCDETGCLAELAEAMDAELIVSGGIAQGADGAALVSMSLVNARALVVVNRVNVTWRGDEGRLPDVVRTSAQRLLLPAKERAPGGVVVTGAPPDARVLVDGVDRSGDHRAGRIAGLDVGVYEVAVEAPERLPRTIPVVVQSGVDTVVEGALEEEPVASAWLWVGGVGAVVGGAALTGAVLFFAGRGDVDVTADVPPVSVNDVERLRGIGK